VAAAHTARSIRQNKSFVFFDKVFRKKVHTLLVILHPFYYLGESPYRRETNSWAQLYVDGKPKKEYKTIDLRGSETIYYLKDVLLTICYVLKSKIRFDVFIGFDGLLSLVGLLLRKLGLVKVVVFYMIDWTYIRYKNPIKNVLYHVINHLSARSSDSVWGVSNRMTKIIGEKGVEDKRILVVPRGVPFELLRNRMRSQRFNDQKTLVYFGGLTKSKGPQLIVEAMPEIIAKVPNAKLILIGSGPLEEELKSVVKRGKMWEYVRFLGRLPYIDAMNILRKCSVGLAPYNPKQMGDTANAKYADPGKVREYLACGLPVVITRVPEIAFEIQKNGAGLTIDYDKDDLIRTVSRLLMDEDFLKGCRSNASKMGAKYDFTRLFCNALETVYAAHAPHNH
jgi:glycosyltransferase involved in cell wall biosynthesis